MAGISLGTVRGPFIEEFRPFCDEALEPVRGLEMASRCVVETGTATFYTDSVARQSRPGAGPADPADRRRRGAPLQAFLSLFPALSRGRASRPRRGRAGLVAKAEHDRRRGQALSCSSIFMPCDGPGHHSTRCLSSLHRQCRALMRPHFPHGNERADAAEAARSRTPNSAGDGSSAGCAGATERSLAARFRHSPSTSPSYPRKRYPGQPAPRLQPWTPAFPTGQARGPKAHGATKERAGKVVRPVSTASRSAHRQERFRFWNSASVSACRTWPRIVP